MGVTSSKPEDGAALYLRDQSRCKLHILSQEICDDANQICALSLNRLSYGDELETARRRPNRAKCIPSDKGQREP